VSNKLVLAKFDIQSSSNDKYPVRTDPRLFVNEKCLLFDSKFEGFLVFETNFAICVIGGVFIIWYLLLEVNSVTFVSCFLKACVEF
jgi:hypothetical protein